jgi:hypothetical protein
MNTKETKMGIVKLYDNYFIFQPNANSIVDMRTSQDLKAILEDEYNNKNFCCIVDNKNNPSFDYVTFSTIIKEISVISQLRGLARINSGYDIKSLLQLHNMTSKQIKYEEFNKMEEAITWVGDLLK